MGASPNPLPQAEEGAIAMRTADFDYELPPELIAQHPPERRDAARMLVLDPRSGNVTHSTISNLPNYLEPGDLLVLNDTRVIPARLIGRRADGGEAEVLLLRPLNGDRHRWEALIRPGRRLKRRRDRLFDRDGVA